MLTRDKAEHLTRLKSLEILLMEFENDPSENAGPVIDMALLSLVSPSASDIGSGTRDASFEFEAAIWAAEEIVSEIDKSID